MAGKVAAYIFTVVIPVVVAAMLPHIGLEFGLPVILVSIVIGSVDFAWAYSTKRHGKAKVGAILLMAAGAGLFGGGGIWFFLGSQKQKPAAVEPASSAKNTSPTAPAFALVDPRASLRHNPDGSERIFVQITPDNLMGEFKTHTDEHAKEIVSRYIGKWMALSGTVHNISVDSRGGIEVDLTAGADAISALMNGMLQLHFDSKWREKLNVLQKGNRINAVCQIHDIAQFIMAFGNCELIE